MTLFRGDVYSFATWGKAIEGELDLVEIRGENSCRKRTFCPIGQDEFLRITGASVWTWKMYSKRLKDAGQLADSGGWSRISLEQLHAFMDENKIRPRRPEGVTRAIRIAFVNFKGGLAKSSTILHVGQRLAIDGYRVLVIDLDGQATLTRYLMHPKRIRPEQTFAAAMGLHEDEDGGEVVGHPMPLQPIKTFVDGLDIIPASTSVACMDMELVKQMRDDPTKAAEIPDLFQQAIEGIDHAYDFVLMDLPPSFSFAHTVLLRLSDSLMLRIPTERSDFASSGNFLKISGKWLGVLERSMGPKQFDPVLALNVPPKRLTASLSEKERCELERRLQAANAMYGIAGRIFGVHRPMQTIEDQPVTGTCLAHLKSVYEAAGKDYDRRAIKVAREHHNAVTGQLLAAVKLRWEEVVNNGGDYSLHSRPRSICNTD